jgi:hypothetical protein
MMHPVINERVVIPCAVENVARSYTCSVSFHRPTTKITGKSKPPKRSNEKNEGR